MLSLVHCHSACRIADNYIMAASGSFCREHIYGRTAIYSLEHLLEWEWRMMGSLADSLFSSRFRVTRARWKINRNSYNNAYLGGQMAGRQRTAARLQVAR